MFACIFHRSVSKSAPDSDSARSLCDLAFTFSPLVEQTCADTVVLDISGQDLLFGETQSSVPSPTAADSAHNLVNEISRQAKALDLQINVAVAANPDTAIHAARNFKGVTIVSAQEELVKLEKLSIKKIDSSLAAIEANRAAEIQETLAFWGVRTFGDLARLPLTGIAERLGQEGVRLQKLAQGRSDRRLNLVGPPVGFAQALELEYPVSELEPLSFILSRLLNQLCANLREYALATNEVRLQLKLVDKTEHRRAITLPVPMRNHKTLLRLLLFVIEAQPPAAPIIGITIMAEPVKPRESQAGLFIPLAPDPEKLEITLARLVKLVGENNVGSPELLDTHRPDAFRVNKFQLNQRSRKNSAGNPPVLPVFPVAGFRVFRPPCVADVQTVQGRPARIHAQRTVRGKVICAAGPWRTSGDWWRHDVWARDEWDVAVIDPAARESEVLCRIYRDLQKDKWFVAGIYD